MIERLTILLLQILLVFQFLGCSKKAPEKEKSYFKGEVEYAYTYESDVLDLDSLKAAKPHIGVFRYDEDNYQSTFFSSIDTVSYYYLSETNSAISQTNEVLDRSCIDYGVATDSIIYFNIYETNEKVMYQNCKVIEYKSKSMWNQYLVSKEVKISPKIYKNHLAYNWQFYGQESDGGLILRLEHIFKDYSVKGVATRIKILYNSETALKISEAKLKAICMEG